MNARRKLLVVEVAALGWDLVSRRKAGAEGFAFQALETCFPALTCTAQAGFRTGARPAQHGLLGNGIFLRELRRPMFWEQSAALVSGPRFWAPARAGGRRVGLMFWQQSLGEAADLLLSPKPVHKHHGGMIQDGYSQPPDLYDRITRAVGRPFNLMHYWGPLASAKSSDWIVAALRYVMQSPDLAPDLLLGYLPHLDYDLQRHGPESAAAGRALARVLDYLCRLRAAAEASGYELVVWGDYAIEPVAGSPVFPNKALRQAGFFKTRAVRGRLYPDFFASCAFALCDHQIAQIHVQDADTRRVADVLARLEGVDRVLDRAEQDELGVGHPRGGELMLVAEKGRWLAYPWWDRVKEAPDYASHVDIHNKPGYDPCELFFGWPPPGISTDPSRIKGTHGRPGHPVAWWSSFPMNPAPATLYQLAEAVQQRLESGTAS